MREEAGQGSEGKPLERKRRLGAASTTRGAKSLNRDLCSPPGCAAFSVLLITLQCCSPGHRNTIPGPSSSPSLSYPSLSFPPLIPFLSPTPLLTCPKSNATLYARTSCSSPRLARYNRNPVFPNSNCKYLPRKPVLKGKKRMFAEN
jgi:hypothetical protein